MTEATGGEWKTGNGKPGTLYFPELWRSKVVTSRRADVNPAAQGAD